MKDLYSAHATEEDMVEYYEKVSGAYLKIFKRLGFEVYVTEAAGGVFTDRKTREYQVVAESGEDTIYIKPGTKEAFNKEVFEGDESKYEMKRSIEVGNIFPFGDKKYAEMMKVGYTDKDGQKKLVHFASYGIGVTRLLGTLVEVNHDGKGIIWPKAVAPYQVHLVSLGAGEKEIKRAAEIHGKLEDAGADVLWDDTDRGAGEKFADADLLGIPVRLVVSEKTGEKVEWKGRDSGESELIGFDEAIKRLK